MTKDKALKMALDMPFITIEQKSRFRDEIARISKEALEQPAQSDVDLELKQFSKNLIDNQIQDEHPLSSEQLWGLYETEQPAQEPNCYGDGNVYRGLRSEDSKVKTYHVNTHPHHWQGLTDDEIQNILTPIVLLDNADSATDYEIARAIEAKLKEKNHV